MGLSTQEPELEVLGIIALILPNINIIPRIKFANDTQFQQKLDLSKKLLRLSLEIFFTNKQNNENIHKTTKDAAH